MDRLRSADFLSAFFFWLCQDHFLEALVLNIIIFARPALAFQEFELNFAEFCVSQNIPPKLNPVCTHAPSDRSNMHSSGPNTELLEFADGLCLTRMVLRFYQNFGKTVGPYGSQKGQQNTALGGHRLRTESVTCRRKFLHRISNRISILPYRDQSSHIVSKCFRNRAGTPDFKE